MAFVNALLTEAEKADFKVKAIPNPIITSFILEPSRWTIDREQNVYFCYLSQDRESPNEYSFLFCWKDTPLLVKVEEYWVEGYIRTWKLQHLALPAHYKEQQDEILNSLKDALKVWAFNGDPNDPLNQKIEVQFNF